MRDKTGAAVAALCVVFMACSVAAITAGIVEDCARAERFEQDCGEPWPAAAITSRTTPAAPVRPPADTDDWLTGATAASSFWAPGSIDLGTPEGELTLGDPIEFGAPIGAHATMTSEDDGGDPFYGGWDTLKVVDKRGRTVFTIHEDCSGHEGDVALALCGIDDARWLRFGCGGAGR